MGKVVYIGQIICPKYTDLTDNTRIQILTPKPILLFFNQTQTNSIQLHTTKLFSIPIRPINK